MSKRSAERQITSQDRFDSDDDNDAEEVCVCTRVRFENSARNGRLTTRLRTQETGERARADDETIRSRKYVWWLAPRFEQDASCAAQRRAAQRSAQNAKRPC